MRPVAVLTVAGAVPALVGALVFWALNDGTALTHAIAYGLWVAAAVMLALMIVAGRKIIWRHTSLPVLEGWVFVAAATVLTLAGAGIDVAGGY